MEAVLRWLCATSIQVTVLVVVLAAAEKALARWLTPRWRYALWLVVLLRLFAPGLPELPRGAVDWRLSAAAPAAGAGPAAVGDAQAPAAGAGRPEPAAPLEAGERGQALSAEEPSRAPAASPPVPAQTAEPLSAPAPAAAARPSVAARLAPWAVLLWIGVALALLARDALRERAFRRRVASAQPVRDPALCALFADCCRRAGFARAPLLLATDAVSSPAAMGWRHPRVLLPHAVAARFGADELRRVFLHELAHLRRGDVPLNAALVLAGRAWWFHPFVALAFARLRAAQESARDFEALALAREADPVPYARTLLRLCEELPAARRQPALSFLSRESSLKGRIVMLTRFKQPTFAHSFLGLGLVAGLGWLAFTTASAAAPDPAGSAAAAAAGQATGGGGSGGGESFETLRVGAEYVAWRDELHAAGNALESVRVERQGPPEAWRAPLAERLGRATSVDFQETPVRDVLEHVRRSAGVEVLLEPDTEELLDRTFSLAGDEVTAQQVLDLLGRDERDLAWCQAGGAVRVGYEGGLSEPKDVRFYNTGALLPASEDDGGAVEEALTLIQDFTQPFGDWNFGDVSIESWRGLIVVRQTDAMHARVEEILNRMLNRGARPPAAEPRWRARLAEALAQTVSVSADGADPAELARGLGLAQGVPVVVPTELDGREPVTLTLEDVPLRIALERIAALAGLAAFAADGALVLDEYPPVEVEFFEVGDLVHPRPGADDERAADGLIDMVRNYVDPESWNGVGYVTLWRDLLVVAQSRAALDATRDLLEAARRASAGR